MRKYLFIDQNIERLKADAKNHKEKQFKLLIDQCDKYFSYEISKTHPPKSTTYMGMAIANLSLAYKITEDKKYLKEAMRFIKAVCGYEKWGHAHLVNVDLSASWIMFGLSLGFNWLYEDLLEEELKMIEDKLYLQATIMFNYRQETYGDGWSTNFFQNHNWINMTGLAAAGFALKEKYPEETKVWLETCEENFNEVYPYLPEDGSFYEGVVYWRYGAMWLFIYAHLIKSETGKDYFKETRFLENTFYYRLYQAVPDLEQTANFGDTHDTRSGHSTAVYYKVASEYNNGYAQNLGTIVESEFLEKEAAYSKVKPGILPEAWINFLWYNPEVKTKAFNTLPLTKYFPDLGLITYRSSWEKDALFLTFKAGAPGGKKQWDRLWELKERNIDAFGLSHHHPDNLSFIMFYKGEYLVIDDGYNRHMKAAYHSVPLIDETGYPVEDVNDVLTKSLTYLKEINPKLTKDDFVSEIISYLSQDEYLVFTAHAEKMYHPNLKMEKVERTIISTGNQYFITIDQLKSLEEHSYQYLIQAPTKYEKDKQGLHIKNGVAELNVLNLNEDTKDRLKETTIKAVMTTQEPDNYCIQELKTLMIETKNKQKDYDMINLLMVSSQGEAKHEVTQTKLETTIIYKNNKDIIINQTQYQDHHIESDAKYIVISYKNNLIDNYIIIGGTYLKVNEKLIIHQKAKNNHMKKE